MSGHLDDDDLVALSLTGEGHGHLAGCAACAARLAPLRRVVSAARPGSAGELGDEGARVEPPPHLWARVAAEAGVPADPRAPLRAVGPPLAAPPRPAAPRRARGRLPLLLAAAAAVGMVLGGGLTWLAVSAAGPAPEERVVAAARLTPAPGASGSGEATLDRSGDGRRLTVDARLPAAGRGYYEVWLVDTSDGGLVSLGVLPAGDDAASRLVVPTDVDLGAYRTVDVSLESLDGDPGHSGESVLRGTLSPGA